MPVPVLRPTAALAENFAGVTYYIEGELVPVLHLELSGMPVYFEHYILLWKDLNVRIGIRPLKGALKRVLAGMPVFLTEASGPGQIGFSRDGAGHIFAMHLNRYRIGIRPLKGALKRVLAGMPVFLTEASGPGQIGFSRDGAGHIFAMHLN